MSSHQPLSHLGVLHRQAYEQCVPWFVTIELGLQCNLSCTHCYNFDRSDKKNDLLKMKVNKTRIIRLIEELHSEGTLMIAFSGGEALLNKDLFDYITKVRELNMMPKLKTNGTLIDREMALKIKNSEIYDVDISVYGAQPQSHDWLTKVEHSYFKTINGIKNLREQNVNVSMNYIIHQNNYHEIDKMIEIANSLECQFSFSTDLTERYDHSTLDRTIAITPDQYKELLTKHTDLFYDTNPDSAFQCECARTVCAIASNGDVYPCIGAPIPSGNIYDQSFDNIWRNSEKLNEIRNLKKENFKTCNSCDLATYCTRSSGSAYANTGNYTGPNPQNCMEAKMRSELRF